MSREKHHVYSGPPPRSRFRLTMVSVFALVVLGCGFIIVRSIVTAGPHAAVGTTPANQSQASTGGVNCGPKYTFRSESWPNCSDTGVARGTILTRKTGDLIITKDGTVLDRVYLVGSLDIHANNVTVENSIILSSNWWGIFQRSGYHGLRILHDTIMGDPKNGPDSGGEDIGVWNLGGSIQIGYSNISQFGGDVDIVTGDIYDNYLHDEQAFGSEGVAGCKPLPNPIPDRCYNHSDAMGMDGGTNITLRHNTLIQSPIPGATSALELDDDLGTISNVTVRDNYLAGGTYCTYGGSRPDAAASTNISYIDNAFATLYWANCGTYGSVAYFSTTGVGNVWFGNYWADGSRVGKPVN